LMAAELADRRHTCGGHPSEQLNMRPKQHISDLPGNI
jgi:hypothetical protein